MIESIAKLVRTVSHAAPSQPREEPTVPSEDEAVLELSDDDLEHVVGGLERTYLEDRSNNLGAEGA